MTLHALPARAETDILHGVDYEVAQEVLAGWAGEAWSLYHHVKLDPGSAPEKVQAAWISYSDATARMNNLRVSDSEAIADILIESKRRTSL